MVECLEAPKDNRLVNCSRESLIVDYAAGTRCYNKAPRLTQKSTNAHDIGACD